MKEKIMKDVLAGFEQVIKENGLNCMKVKDRADFLRQVYERELVYEGFVIVQSEKQSGIFYVDTQELMPSGRYRAPRPLKRSDFDIPSSVPRMNTSVADAIDLGS